MMPTITITVDYEVRQNTLFGACPPKPGGESLDAAKKVVTKWGLGAAVRQFKTNLSAPNSNFGEGIVHTSYKPVFADVMSGKLDSQIADVALATPSGHVIEAWHEADSKFRKGEITFSEAVAVKNRFYDIVKSTKPDVLVANTVTGWLFEPSSKLDWRAWGEVKADIIGVDCDGIVPKVLPYPSYSGEIETAKKFLEEFSHNGYKWYSVPEFGAPRMESDTNGVNRSLWLTQCGNAFKDSNALYVCLYEYDSTPFYELTTAAERAAWLDLKG